MGKKVRIKEIAKLVGCSPSTVSQAFNSPKLVNRKTRLKIIETCEKLGYTRKKYDSKSKRIIGITGASAELLFGHYSSPIITAIISAAKKDGVNVIIEPFSDEEETMPHMFSKRVLDGVIMFSKMSPDHILIAKQMSIPIVLCGHPLPNMELHTILPDGRNGTYEATKHLISLGHRKIAHVTGGPISEPVVSDRIDGFRFAMEEAKIKVKEDYLAIADFCKWETPINATEKLLNLPDPPTAIIYQCDVFAYLGYRFLKEKGLEKKISIVGFDNIPMPYFTDVKPKLTTVEVDFKELGTTAFNVLKDIICNPSRIACRYTMPVKLIIGETTRKITD